MTHATDAPQQRERPLIAAGDCLPRLSFPRLDGPGQVSWTQGPMAPVIFMPHVGGCPECARYVAQLGTAVDRLREWATRPLLLVAAEDGSRAASAAQPFAGQPGLIALVDVTGTGRAQLGGGKEQAIVVQADRWGAVYDVQASGLSKDQHAALPTPEDLVALAKFIDIQCPECGIPSKEWLGVSPFPLG